jgi:hypothetical protein
MLARLAGKAMQRQGARGGRKDVGTSQLRRSILWALGIAAAGLIGCAWLHRVELFEVPLLASGVRSLAILRLSQPDDPAFQSSLHWGLSPFDFDVSSLIRLQRPGFLGGRDFSLTLIRSRDGRPTFIASYEALSVSFDEEPDPDAEYPEVVVFCPVVLRHVLALDASGKVRGDPILLHREQGDGGDPVPPRVLRAAGGFDLLRFPAHCSGVCLAGGAQGSLEYELSADDSGLVSHGLVVFGDLQAPPESARPLPLDRERLVALLDSARPADLHRALTLLEGSDGREMHLIEHLLDHAHPALRARAAGVLAQDPSLARLAFPLLSDPSPRVRFAALHAARSADGWERAIDPVTIDGRPEIARAARCALSRSEDPAMAGAATLHLVLRREEWVLSWPWEPFATARLAEAVLDWIEAVSLEEAPSSLCFNLRYFFQAEALRPLFSRVLNLFQAGDPEHPSRRELALALYKADERRAEEALLDALGPQGMTSLGEELYPEEWMAEPIEVEDIQGEDGEEPR